VGALREVAFFPCPKASLPLWSPEVSTPKSHSLTGPSGSLPLRAPPCQCPSQGHILSDSMLGRPLAAVGWPHAPGLTMRWPFNPPFLRRAPTPQMLQRWLYQPRQQTRHWQGLGHGKCSAHDQQHSPSSDGVRFNTQGFDFPPVYVDLHNVPPSPTGSTYTGDTGALATADRTPHPLDILMGPARPALSFVPTVQHTYR